MHITIPSAPIHTRCMDVVISFLEPFVPLPIPVLLTHLCISTFITSSKKSCSGRKLQGKIKCTETNLAPVRKISLSILYYIKKNMYRREKGTIFAPSGIKLLKHLNRRVERTIHELASFYTFLPSSH